MIHFIEEKFSSLLKECEPYAQENMVRALFPGEEGDELKRKEHLFELGMAIMKAKSTSALNKYSIEDIIACVEVHDEVCKTMEKATAGKTFNRFLRVIIKSHSCKSRRVL